MRNVFLTTISGLGLIILSCNNPEVAEDSGISEKAKRNIEAAQAIADAFGTGDLSRIDSVVAEDYIDHTERGDMNRDSLKLMVQQVRAANTDMKMEVIKQIADEDYVFTWARFTGISKGNMMPAGPYDMKAMHVMRFRDGKAVEQWNFMEIREMMKMMSSPETAGNRQ